MANEIEPPEPDLSNISKHLANKRPLLRVVAWGSAAAIALGVAAIATQTEPGTERLQLALASQGRPAAVVAEIPKIDKEAEARALQAQQRLEAQLRTLAADRDRLAARVASLERSLDDVTGSIKRQTAQETAAPAGKAAEPSAAPATQSTTAPTRQADAPAIPPAPPKVELSAVAPAPAAAATSVSAPEAVPPQAVAHETSAPVIENVPLPPVRTAALPPNEPAAEPQPQRKAEIGIDIGGAPNVDVLNLRWAAVKANFGPLLTGLHPLAARVHRTGANTTSSDVRLLVGPLPSMAAATQLCARFAAARVTCRPARFEGERIAQR